MTPGEPEDSQHRPQVSRALFHPYGNPRGTYFHCGSKMRNPRLTIYSHLPKATRITKPGVGDKQDRPVPPPPATSTRWGDQGCPAWRKDFPKSHTSKPWFLIQEPHQTTTGTNTVGLLNPGFLLEEKEEKPPVAPLSFPMCPLQGSPNTPVSQRRLE